MTACDSFFLFITECVFPIKMWMFAKRKQTEPNLIFGRAMAILILQMFFNFLDIWMFGQKLRKLGHF